MSDYYFSISLGNSRSLCISPLTRDELSGLEGTGSGGGYYLYERDQADDQTVVLAKLVSPEAAVRLYEALDSRQSRD